MTINQALLLIIQNQESPALNYAVNYAKTAFDMDENSNEFRVQCLYVLNNIIYWRAKKGDDVMKNNIKEARAAIKKAGGVK